MDVLNEKPVVSVEEQEAVNDSLTPAQIQHRFDTLRGLEDNQMKLLEKALVKKIDWRMMPIITLMFLMK